MDVVTHLCGGIEIFFLLPEATIAIRVVYTLDAVLKRCIGFNILAGFGGGIHAPFILLES